MKSCLLLLILSTTNCTLITNGPWIVNSTTNQRVHLKCVNWYGAHQELYVPGGLERRGVGELVDFVVKSGANCVRMPYSVEMVKYNPVVLGSSVAGIRDIDGCVSTLKALDVMDCVVRWLSDRGIMVIMNCHNSYGTWVGAGAQKYDQGLWNLPGYSTEDWVQSLETMAARYKGKIVGMDLRNEIHDQDGVKITWGESKNVNVDWLAASSLAYDRLFAVDPELLVVVGGLCWNFDLREMMRNVGPVHAFNNKKLIYTVHLYGFSFWWLLENGILTRVLTPIALSLCVLFGVSSIVCFLNVGGNRGSVGYTVLNAKPQPRHFSWWTLILALGSSNYLFSFWLAMAVTYRNVSLSVGCSSLARDALPYEIVFGVCVGLSGIFLVVYVCIMCCWPSDFSCVRVCAWFTLWFALLFASVGGVGLYFGTELSYDNYLNLFALNNRPVPVWVGEFGTGNPDDAMFQYVWRYISKRYDLDFAYWPFNGLKWRNGVWETETFGLMNNDYSAWRIPSFFKLLFKW